MENDPYGWIREGIIAPGAVLQAQAVFTGGQLKGVDGRGTVAVAGIAIKEAACNPIFFRIDMKG